MSMSLLRWMRTTEGNTYKYLNTSKLQFFNFTPSTRFTVFVEFTSLMSLQPKWKSSFCSFRVPLMCENYVIMNAQCDQIDAFHMFPIAAGANSFIRPKYDIGIIQEGFPPDCVLLVSVSGILRWNCGINLDLALIHTQVFLVHCRRPKLQLWDDHLA